MTEKQQRFIDEYMVDFNATRAVIAAGYSHKSANVRGAQLLTIPEVRDEVNRRKAEIMSAFRE